MKNLKEIGIFFFFQVIPQAICSRYGLAVGANLVWLVRILMLVCYPIAWPIGKVIFHISYKETDTTYIYIYIFFVFDSIVCICFLHHSGP